MITGGRHRHRETLKDRSVVVHHRARLAMHKMSGANHAAAKGFPDCLVTEADPKHWNFSCEAADQIDADARVMRRARTGGNDNPLRPQVLDLVDRDLIVAANLDLRAQLADVLNEVVSERIVIVEYENQASATSAISLHRR